MDEDTFLDRVLRAWAAQNNAELCQVPDEDYRARSAREFADALERLRHITWAPSKPARPTLTPEQIARGVTRHGEDSPAHKTLGRLFPQD